MTGSARRRISPSDRRFGRLIGMSIPAHDEARERFTRLIALPEAEIPLAEAALWIAAEGRPHTDVRHCLDQLERLAERAAADTAEVGVAERVARLNRVLFVEERFTGNKDDYENPENSFLDVVLERRLGIPITLSVVYIEVGRMLGLDTSGIAFPGHFLAKVSTSRGEVVVDPFYGAVLDDSGCAERLRQVAGDEAELQPEMLASASPTAILRRVLSNLKHLRVSRSEYDLALACCERILLLAPDDPIERRDRGLVYRELECFGPALDDIDHFLLACPHHPTAAAVTTLRDEVALQARHIH